MQRLTLQKLEANQGSMDATAKRAARMQEVLEGASVDLPAQGRNQGWPQLIASEAMRLVKRTENLTMDRVVTTRNEVRSFFLEVGAEEAQKGLRRLEEATLHTFLMANPAPTRAHQTLTRLNNQTKMWALPKLASLRETSHCLSTNTWTGKRLLPPRPW